MADSALNDIAAAVGLGYTTCWIERRHGDEGSGATPATTVTAPDHHFTSLAGLAEAAGV